MRIHDIPVDVIVTPEEALETRSRFPRPSGIYRDLLPGGKTAAIPVLDQILRKQKHWTREGDGR